MVNKPAPKPTEDHDKPKGNASESNNWRNRKRIVEVSIPIKPRKEREVEAEVEVDKEEPVLPYQEVPPVTYVPQESIPKPREPIPRAKEQEKAYENVAPLKNDSFANKLYDKMLKAEVLATNAEILAASGEMRDKFRVGVSKKRMPLRGQTKHGTVSYVTLKEGSESEEEEEEDEVLLTSYHAQDKDPPSNMSIQLEPDAIYARDLPAVSAFVQTIPQYGMPVGSIVVPDPVSVYLASLPPGEKPKQIIVAKESASLRSIFPVVNGMTQEESLLDSGSQIVSMSEDAAIELGVSWNPAIQIHMQSANAQLEKSCGLAQNIPFRMGDLTVYLQVHVIKDVAYRILLGRPFDLITESEIKNKSDGTQLLTVTCPNTQRRAVLPTFLRGRTPRVASRPTGAEDQSKVFWQHSMN